MKKVVKKNISIAGILPFSENVKKHPSLTKRHDNTIEPRLDHEETVEGHWPDLSSGTQESDLGPVVWL